MSGADPFDMLIIHSVFKREFHLLPGVIRAVPDGDTERSAVVGEHLTMMLEVLHHHHANEDELLWPRLRERAPHHEVLLAMMDSEHRDVAVPVTRAEELAATWTRTASAIDGESLAIELHAVSSLLTRHLENEEARILPLIPDHIEQEEWAVLGQRGVASIRPDKVLMFLAAMQEDTADAEWGKFFAHLPPPVQEAYTTVAVPGYPAYVGAVRGTA